MNKLYCKGLVLKEANGDITVVVSDATVDRSGESIPVDSWDLSNFMKSPRMFVDHDYSVQSITGVWKNPRVEDGKLKMTPAFHELTELARVNKQMVEQGFLNTTSVGFMPKKLGDGRVVNELLEVSWVGVPCNPNAMVERLSVKDISGDETAAVEQFVKEAEEAAAPEEPKAEDAPAADEPKEEEPKADEPAAEPAPEEGGEAKGMIEDALAGSRALREQKYPYLDQMFWAWCNFIDAYLLDSTPVESIKPMCDEMCTNMQAIASGEMQEPGDEGAIMLSMAKFLAHKKMQVLKSEPEEEVGEPQEKPAEGAEQKSGRVLSEKNRGIIQASLDGMSQATAALNDLLAATESSQGVEEKGDDDSKALDEIAKKNRVLRSITTQLGEALSQLRLTR